MLRNSEMILSAKGISRKALTGQRKAECCHCGKGPCEGVLDEHRAILGMIHRAGAPTVQGMVKGLKHGWGFGRSELESHFPLKILEFHNREPGR